MEFATDQKIVLINPNSRNEVGCRVVQVARPTSTLYEVLFEFDEREVLADQFSCRRLGCKKRTDKR